MWGTELFHKQLHIERLNDEDNDIADRVAPEEGNEDRHTHRGLSGFHTGYLTVHFSDSAVELTYFCVQFACFLRFGGSISLREFGLNFGKFGRSGTYLFGERIYSVLNTGIG